MCDVVQPAYRNYPAEVPSPQHGLCPDCSPHYKHRHTAINVKYQI